MKSLLTALERSRAARGGRVDDPPFLSTTAPPSGLNSSSSNHHPHQNNNNNNDDTSSTTDYEKHKTATGTAKAEEELVCVVEEGNERGDREAEVEGPPPPARFSAENLFFTLLLCYFFVYRPGALWLDYATQNFFLLSSSLTTSLRVWRWLCPTYFLWSDRSDAQLVSFCGNIDFLLRLFLLLGIALLACRLSSVARACLREATQPPPPPLSAAAATTTGAASQVAVVRTSGGGSSLYQHLYHPHSAYCHRPPASDAAATVAAEASLPSRAGAGGSSDTIHSSFRPCLPPPARLQASILLFSGLAFLTAVHGTHVVFFLAVLALNYLVFHVVLARLLRAAPPRHRAGLYFAAVWATHIGLLYLCERTEGFQNSVWMQTYFPSSPEQSLRVTGVRRRPWFGIRQRMRWTLVLRMSTLRMISFLYDGHEARAAAATAEGPLAARHALLERHLRTCLECAELREHYRAFVRPQLAAIHRETAAPAADTVDSGDDGSTDKDSGSVDMTPAYLEAELPECCWCYKLRTACPRPTNSTTTTNNNSSGSDYTFLYYMAYLLFLPLYLAGPMMSYNSFVSYLQTPHLATVQLDLWCRGWLRRTFRGLRAGSAAATKLAASTGTSTGHLSARRYVREAAVYLLRFAFTLFCVQLLLHTVFVSAAAAQSQYLSLQLPSTQTYIMYGVLLHIWLKFALMWRFSRFCSLYLCGIDAPEDLERCVVSNLISVRDFWRDWHASFNLWIVRYMYVPMGGSRRKLLSVAPIFFFIALWHDHALHLLHWALCIVVVFVAEMVVSSSFAGLLQRPVAAELARLRAADSRSRDGARHDGGDEGTPQPPAPSPARPFVRRVAGAIHRYEVRGSSPTREVRRRRRARLQLLYRLCVRNVGGMATVTLLLASTLVGFFASDTGGVAARDVAGYRAALSERVALYRNYSWFGRSRFLETTMEKRMDKEGAVGEAQPQHDITFDGVPAELVPLQAPLAAYRNVYVDAALTRLTELAAQQQHNKNKKKRKEDEEEEGKKKMVSSAGVTTALRRVTLRFVLGVAAACYAAAAVGGLRRDRREYQRRLKRKRYGLAERAPTDS